MSHRFTLSSGEAHPDAAAAFFGAPLDATGSFRPGMGGGPGAVRRLSDSLESWGKIDADEARRAVCYCDATIALPILAHALLERGVERKDPPSFDRLLQRG